MSVFPQGWRQPPTVWNQKNWRRTLEEREKSRKEQMERITKAAEDLKKLNGSMTSTQQIVRSLSLRTGAMGPTGLSGSIGVKGPVGEPVELPLSFQTEPIVGLRLWNVDDFQTRSGMEVRLRPVASGGVFYPPMRKMEAFCTHHQHEAPWATCHCGIWALNSEAYLETAARQYVHHRVWGEVYLWGRVLKATMGYRAQFAYPKQLFTAEPELAEQLRALYGVPVTVSERLAAYSHAEVDVTAFGNLQRQYAPGMMWATTTTTTPVQGSFPYFQIGTGGVTYGTTSGSGINIQSNGVGGINLSGGTV